MGNSTDKTRGEKMSEYLSRPNKLAMFDDIQTLNKELSVMVKEQERRIQDVVCELVAVKSTLNDVATFISKPRELPQMLMLEMRLHQRREYLNKVIDKLLQPIVVSENQKESE